MCFKSVRSGFLKVEYYAFRNSPFCQDLIREQHFAMVYSFGTWLRSRDKGRLEVGRVADFNVPID